MLGTYSKTSSGSFFKGGLHFARGARYTAALALFVFIALPSFAHATVTYDNMTGQTEGTGAVSTLISGFTATASGDLSDVVMPYSYASGFTSPSSNMYMELYSGSWGSGTLLDCQTTTQTLSAWGVTDGSYPPAHTPIIDFSGFGGTQCHITAGNTYSIYNSLQSGTRNVDAQPSGLNYAQVYVGGIAPPAPLGDGNYSTHVIRVTAPANYATTTSPVTFNFDSIVGTDYGTTTDGYEITIHDEQTGQSQIYFGLLPSYVVGVPFSVSTSTIAHADGSGLTASIELTSGTQSYFDGGAYPQFLNYGFANGIVSFAIGSTYSSINNPPPPPPYAGNTYASSTCSVNFLGSFNLSGCAGYLFSPASTTMAQFSNISLANRLPFAYGYQVPQIFQTLFTASSTASSTISLPILGGNVTIFSRDLLAAVPFSAFIKIILTGVIWLTVLLAIYRSTMKSHDTTTSV